MSLKTELTYTQIVDRLQLDINKYDIKDISHEVWREYEHGGTTFTISRPIALIVRKGGTTHRIVDFLGISHCHPIPGNGCALRWYNGEGGAVKF